MESLGREEPFIGSRLSVGKSHMKAVTPRPSIPNRQHHRRRLQEKASVGTRRSFPFLCRYDPFSLSPTAITRKQETINRGNENFLVSAGGGGNGGHVKESCYLLTAKRQQMEGRQEIHQLDHDYIHQLDQKVRKKNPERIIGKVLVVKRSWK